MTGEIRENHCYEFADFRLETEKQILSRQNVELHLPQRQFQILRYLLENRERVVSRDELLDKFWEGHEVYDDVLRKAVAALRHALDDTEKPSRFIETRRGSGFRFVGHCTESQSRPAEVRPAILAAPKVSFWRSRIVLLSILAACLILLISVAVSRYSPRTQPDGRGKIPKIGSIAVLPLRNLTGDAANDYLADGLSEGLINEFSRHSELKVISRSSSFSFKNKELELPEIGAKLKVEAILEGSLRKSGDEIRLEANLVDVKDGKVLWTNDAATASIRNLFTAQNRIACDVLAKMGAGNCTPTEIARQIDAEAYRLYLQGVRQRNDLTLASMTKAIESFKRALAIAPNFAKAHEAIATTYIVMESNGKVTLQSVIEKARFHAEEALKLDENSADAYLALSETRTAENYDLPLRESILRQAVGKNPNHRLARMWLANTLTVQGEFAEAESELLQAQELDPLSAGVRLNLGELYIYWRKPEAAIREAGLIDNTIPSVTFSDWILAKAYILKGDYAQAKKYVDKLPDDEIVQITWLLKTGDTDAARTRLKKLEISETGKTSPYSIGYLHAALGHRDEAFAWLEKAYQLRQADLVSMKVEPLLDGVRDDARYQDLLRRVNLAN